MTAVQYLSLLTILLVILAQLVTGTAFTIVAVGFFIVGGLMLIAAVSEWAGRD